MKVRLHPQPGFSVSRHKPDFLPVLNDTIAMTLSEFPKALLTGTL